jgi:hypothetical protein
MDAMKTTRLLPAAAALAALALPAVATAQPTISGIDQNHDRRVDTVLWDAHADGRFDAGAIDTDRNGRFDLRWTDRNFDGAAQHAELGSRKPAAGCRTARVILRCAKRTPGKVFGQVPAAPPPVLRQDTPAPPKAAPPGTTKGPDMTAATPDGPVYETAPMTDEGLPTHELPKPKPPAMPEPQPEKPTMPAYDAWHLVEDCEGHTVRILGTNGLHPRKSTGVDTNGDGVIDLVVVGTAYGPVIDVGQLDGDPCDPEIVVLNNLTTGDEALDLDGDGDIDLVIVGSAKGGVYRGIEKGKAVISHDELPPDHRSESDHAIHVGKR